MTTKKSFSIDGMISLFSKTAGMLYSDKRWANFYSQLPRVTTFWPVHMVWWPEESDLWWWYYESARMEPCPYELRY